ncbi:MAG: M23 family metallopeptidase [Patescibacteria group bacterium]
MEKTSQLCLLVAFAFVIAMNSCDDNGALDETTVAAEDGLKLDPATGVPYAYVFQFPISGFDSSDFGFGFGSRNDYICIEYSSGQCTAYGYHLGRDTQVKKTPVGTEVVAPADGVVRLTTDMKYGGFGSGSAANADYKGCLLLLEHEFPNGQPITTLLGHIKCESGVAYNAETRTGNPLVGSIVKRGQYLGHINHYWAGATQSVDWHHLHWGMRKGTFNTGNVGAYIKGYAKKSEFSTDPTTGFMTHPEWLDPFLIVAANGDPALAASADVYHHPSGSLLEDENGAYWLVKSDTEIAYVPTDVLSKDKYDLSRAVKVSDDEMNCYSQSSSVVSLGNVTLYKHPNSTAVAIAYASSGMRYDFIRWEAMLSWGFEDSDLTHDASTIQFLEMNYLPAGFKLLRPGTLVKADEESEVAIVTYNQTRLPIASAEVFEALGYSWERIVSIPKSVITQVAGPRENNKLVDQAYINTCAVPPECESNGTCGGGGEHTVPDAGTLPAEEVCNGQDDDGNGQIDEIFMCKFGSMGNGCITSCNTAGNYLCTAPSCSWGTCMPYPEVCNNTIDDDCNGLVDCADPACSDNSVCTTGNNNSTLHLVYGGPVIPGSIHLEGWWQPPNALPRQWGNITECGDAVAGDGWLDCEFLLPTGTSPFEFQIILPDGRFWGDKSCSPQGGCGNTVGNLFLFSQGGLVNIEMIPNNTEGSLYFNGRVPIVP